MSLLSFPHEIIERILISVDLASVLSCKLVNKELNFIINSSPHLQYRLACVVAGVIDNPSPDCTLSYAQRLEALRKQEESWQTLKPVFATTIKVNHLASAIYDLTAGVYLLGDANLRDLHYCRLPSSPEDVPKWVKIPGHGPEQQWSGFIVGMGLAIYEHDLIINVISSQASPQNGMNRYSLDLVLLQFSTGEYHPLARHPCIHVRISSTMRPPIALEIVGDNLALVVNSRQGASSDVLFIFDWKTGVKRLQHEPGQGAYTRIVFVSPEFLLVPNRVLSQFEVWFLPAALSSGPYQAFSLQLPTSSIGYLIITFSCRGEHNPFLSSIHHVPPSRPFLSSPDESIIIANLHLAAYPQLGMALTIVMRRRDLLDVINQYMLDRHSLNHQAEVSIEGGESGGYTIRSKIAQPNLPHAPLATPKTFTAPTPSSPPDTINYSIPAIPWSSWGSSITRWLQTGGSQPWFTTSAGQRCAFLAPVGPGGTKMGVIVVDFSPESFNMHTRRRRNGSGLIGEAGEYLEMSSEGWEVTFGEKGDKLDHGGLFSEDINMGLPCLVFMATGEYEFDGLLMDEERLLGLKIDAVGHVESVTAHYFG